jgi:hypothetical protein
MHLFDVEAGVILHFKKLVYTKAPHRAMHITLFSHPLVPSRNSTVFDGDLLPTAQVIALVVKHLRPWVVHALRRVTSLSFCLCAGM